ncbi:dermonecrotic toxin domain-containing protein [Pseudomonas vranovensis]|uniref:dermonecrotic toxin domain-containing protein n=2 Tax=Pseudomonas vranovensis TaxID=321661 RepID=UPI003D987450
MPSSHPNVAFMQARVPSWIAQLKRTELAAMLPDSATTSQPQWLTGAARPMRNALHASQARSHASRHEAAKAFANLQSAYEFCKPVLEQWLQTRFQATADILEARFVLRTAGFKISSVSLFEAALKNFSSDELAALKSDKTSVLTATDSAPPYPDLLPISAADFAAGCRELDLGKRYQAHLESVLSNASDKEVLRNKKKTAMRDLMEVEANIARIKGDIDEQGYTAVLALLRQSADARVDSPLKVGLARTNPFNASQCSRLALFGVALTQIVIIAPSVTNATATVPCIVHIPADPLHPLKQYASLEAFKSDLIGRLADREFRLFLARFATIKERPAFLDLLVDPISLHRAQHWQQVDVRRELFDVLYSECVQFIRDESAALVVSTQDTDDISRGDLDKGYNTSLAVLGGATLFMPVMGIAFIAVLAAKLLTHFFHGADHWSVRVQESGQAFLRAILLNAAIADGEEEDELSVPSAMAGLVLVRLDDGREQLWHPDLLPYARNVRWKNQLAPNRSNGIYDADGKQWVRIDSDIYQIEKDAALDKWRIVSPRDSSLFRPALEHNGQGAWHHVMEQPQRWSKATLLRRLGHLVERFAAAELHLLGEISGVTTEELQQVFRDDQPLPGVLHETLIRLAVDRQVLGLVNRARKGNLLAEDYAQVAQILVQLPNWPQGKTIELYDSVEFWGEPLQVHGSAQEGIEPLKVARADLQHNRLIDKVVQVLEDAPRRRRDLSDDEDEPEDDSASRRASVCADLANGLERVRRALFDQFYQNSTPSLLDVAVDDEQALATLQRLFPGLTRAVAAQVLRDVDVRERARWQAGQEPSLALTERVVEVSRRVRLSRAFTDFELGYLQNNDTQVLALNLLEHLPGWPGRLRLELRESTRTGALVSSIGELSATNSRVLVRMEQRWELYDAGGLNLGSFASASYGFFACVFAALPALTRNALPTSMASAEALRRRLRDLATEQPDRARGLLGIAAPPDWLSASLPAVAGRRAYPGSSAINRLFGSRTPQQRLEAMFVDDTPEQIAVRLERLTGSAQQSEQAVAALERASIAFSVSLDNWVEGGAFEIVLHGHDQRYWSGREQRQRVAQLLSAAWRFRTVEDRVIRLPSGGIELRLSGLALDSLPVLNGELAGVEVLVLSVLDITSIPEGFLRAFPNLRDLQIEGIVLQSLPADIGQLPVLEYLSLACPGMGPEALAPLRHSTSLTTLYIEFATPVPIRWSAEHLAALAAIETLRVLSIFDSQALFEAGALAQLTQLQWLLLIDNHITLDADTVEQWQGLTRLQHLDLSGNPLGMAPHLGNLTGLQRLRLDQTGITEWPQGLETLPALTLASLLENHFTQVPEGAGRVPGLRLTLSYLPQTERVRVEAEMAAVGNPHQAVESAQREPLMNLFEGGDALQRARWQIVRLSQSFGMGLLFDVLERMGRTESARLSRDAFLQQVQSLFDLMYEQQVLRDAICRAVVRYTSEARDDFYILDQVLEYALAQRAIHNRGGARSVLIAQGRLRGRSRALLRHIEAHFHEWRQPGRAIDLYQVFEDFHFRLAQRLPMTLPLLGRTIRTTHGWITENHLQAALDAVSRSEATDLNRWLRSEGYWAGYLRAVFPARYGLLNERARMARDYLNALAQGSQQPETLDDEVRNLLAMAMEVQPASVATVAQDPERMPQWRGRLESLVSQQRAALTEALTEEVIAPVPPA